MKGIRGDIEREYKLAKVRPHVDQKIGKSHGGKRWKEGSTGTKVIYCEGCGAPVTDSVPGRRAHAIRRPECAAFVGV